MDKIRKIEKNTEAAIHIELANLIAKQKRKYSKTLSPKIQATSRKVHELIQQKKHPLH
ncbi:MAG: hypothetical protein JW769_02385 [Parachlamydiales bacterium]|nr:hypothetical protein [Parachlamydiales bacterium]